MKKILFIIFLFIFSFPAYAGNNLSVTCDANSCTKSSNLPLFDEVNIAPGFSQTQMIKVKNERLDSCNLQFKINETSAKSPLSTVQMLSVFNGETMWQAGSFNDFTDNNYYKLGNIDSYQYKEYLWTASLNQSLGNDYQQLKSFFDLDLNFSCGVEDSDNSCNQLPPLHYPQNLKATPGQNSVTLTWEETGDIISYYLISYSTHDHAATFANANIGGPGTTSYTINNLSADVTYYFKIRTGNICAPGPFSDIVFAIPIGDKLITSSLSILHPAVLGENNSVDSIPVSTADIKPTKCFNLFPYAFILALIVNLIISRFYFISLLVSLLSLLADYYLNKYLCRNYHYFYINNFLSFLLPFIFSLKKQKT